MCVFTTIDGIQTKVFPIYRLTKAGLFRVITSNTLGKHVVELLTGGGYIDNTQRGRIVTAHNLIVKGMYTRRVGEVSHMLRVVEVDGAMYAPMPDGYGHTEIADDDPGYDALRLFGNERLKAEYDVDNPYHPDYGLCHEKDYSNILNIYRTRSWIDYGKFYY